MCFYGHGWAVCKKLGTYVPDTSTSTSREVNEARRHRACIAPCAFEEKKREKKNKKNPAAPKTHPLEKAFF